MRRREVGRYVQSTENVVVCRARLCGYGSTDADRRCKAGEVPRYHPNLTLGIEANGFTRDKFLVPDKVQKTL
jgi:hypothetical protein